MTSAYKKKLEEDKKWLAEEKVREAQEQKNDVVKKGHMGDFYRFVCLLFFMWVSLGGWGRQGGRGVGGGLWHFDP